MIALIENECLSCVVHNYLYFFKLLNAMKIQKCIIVLCYTHNYLLKRKKCETFYGNFIGDLHAYVLKLLKCSSEMDLATDLKC